MNSRILIVAVGIAALIFAGYQGFLIARSEPRTASAPPPAGGNTAPVKLDTPPPLPTPTIAPASFPGMDEPYSIDVARRITAEQVKERLDKGQKIVFVDTRHEIPDVMIKGAVQVPEEKVEAWSKNVPKTAFLVFYCTCPDELTAAHAVLALQKKGYRTAYALRDGLFAWQSFDLPTQQPPQPGPGAAS